MTKGFTTLEVVATLTILAILTAISIPTYRTLSDQIAVKQAVHETSVFIQRSRLAAVLNSSMIRVVFGKDQLEAYEESGHPGVADRLIITQPGSASRGVDMTVSRSEIRFQPSGLGWGAGNTKLVFWRGRARDSISTSILGRVRRFH
jgi:type II secretory pathway pseudopilin PulG